MYVQFLFQLKQKKENKMFTKVMSRKLITLEKKYYFCPLTTRNVENLSQIIWFSLKKKKRQLWYSLINWISSSFSVHDFSLHLQNNWLFVRYIYIEIKYINSVIVVKYLINLFYYTANIIQGPIWLYIVIYGVNYNQLSRHCKWVRGPSYCAPTDAVIS